MTRLSRTVPGTPPVPAVRVVHIGVGNFHRAHQAWYTAHSPDAEGWGIAGFTGRSAAVSELLQAQDGLYTLITRSADHDSLEIVGSLATVRPAGDLDAFLILLARPEVAVVSATVTEHGYQRDGAGDIDLDRPLVQADLAALRAGSADGAGIATLPGRLVAGLRARREAEGGPITVLSCDNLPSNGPATRRVVLGLAEALDPALASWIEEQVEFASSMVDRITPATTDEDRELVARDAGYTDAAPVPTEPFSEWVIGGEFRAGRPSWDEAGARLVEDVEPFERRKLWLLNGSHSLLAYAGGIRGHQTVDEAIADDDCRSWVEALWDEACRHLDLGAGELHDYRAALLERYANRRVRHRLSQVAADGSQKLPVRIVPVLRAERADGRIPLGCATAVAAWTLHLRGAGVPVVDDGAEPARQAAHGALAEAIPKVLDVLDPGRGEDADFVAAVREQADRLHPGRELS